MRGFLLAVALCASACASPQPEPGDAVDRAPDRVLEADVVDLRNIWHPNTGLDADKATARGLKTTGLRAPVRVVATRRGSSYTVERIHGGPGGTVTLDCLLDVEGRARDCHMITGPEQLRTSAIATVSSWRWEPLRVDGVPKRAAVHLEVTAHLVQEEVSRN